MDTFNILMIDDDPEDQWIIKEAMEMLNAGGCISFAANGKDALIKLDLLTKSGHRTPRLIILDLNMPVMNGTNTLMRLKEDKRLRLIPVIIFSTSINPFEQQKCMELGAHSYITKPVTIEESIHTSKIFLEFCT
jgi:CheY-like chemotaxis protein